MRMRSIISGESNRWRTSVRSGLRRQQAEAASGRVGRTRGYLCPSQASEESRATIPLRRWHAIDTDRPVLFSVRRSETGCWRTRSLRTACRVTRHFRLDYSPFCSLLDRLVKIIVVPGGVYRRAEQTEREEHE